jgi:hypothetical protein
VRVSLTLPVVPTGLRHDGIRIVRMAINNGVHVGVVNVMEMDFHDSSLDYNGRIGWTCRDESANRRDDM